MKLSTSAIIAKFALKENVTVAESSNSRDGAQIEIRKEGSLCWRAWEFEAGFELDLLSNLNRVGVMLAP
ncbi:hypothetical protein NGK36_17170 [Hafnia alvei]|uniref:hypothetical protein n=1 Tax=Hafnia alvei TaxID=569 RepID=UPI002DB87747|nr:hypothetical protein [Hafnia alvei]MEB7891003.1 hypothetical protein [Hafnia alvei]